MDVEACPSDGHQMSKLLTEELRDKASTSPLHLHFVFSEHGPYDVSPPIQANSERVFLVPRGVKWRWSRVQHRNWTYFETRRFPAW